MRVYVDHGEPGALDSGLRHVEHASRLEVFQVERMVHRLWATLLPDRAPAQGNWRNAREQLPAAESDHRTSVLREICVDGYYKAMMTRRDCAKGILLTALPGGLAGAANQGHSVRNDNLELETSIRNGKVVSRRFHNRLTREIMELPEEQFAFEFDGGAVVESSALEAKLVAKTPARIELLFIEPDGPLEARVRYDLPPGKAYLRKQIWARLKGGGSRRLIRADLDNWRGVKRAWDSMHGDRLPYGSHPIFCDTLWAGVEFVAAFNEYASDGFVLRSRPGGKRVTSEWLALHSTVAGVAEPKAVREAFLRYIEDVRLSPPRMMACYNSWWSLPLRFNHEEHLALMGELKRKLFDKHGVFFDLVATDEGWTDPQTIWEVDRRSLPRGFADTRAIVESAGGKLGLWISPSEIYPRTCDYAWAEKSGYVVLGWNKETTPEKRRGRCP